MPLVLQPNAAVITNLRRKPVGDEDIASAKGHAAGTLYVAPDGAVLLLRRSPTEENFAGHWSLPGGGIEDGESPEDGARREAMEEMGPDIPQGKRKLIDQKVTPTGMVFHTFGQPVDEKFTPKLNAEHTGFDWAPMNALPSPMHPAVQGTLNTRLGLASDMSPEDWEGMVGGLLKFLAEEAQEPEHAEDADFSESDHPRAPDGKFGSGSGTSSGGIKTKKKKSAKEEYQERPPLSFNKDSPGSARYVVHNGTVRPYEGASLLDSPASLLEYKIDVDHKGTIKTTGRVEDQGGGHFKFILDIDKMQPVPYEMSGKPTPESVERQVGFNEAIKRGKSQGESKRIENQSQDFVDGYRQGLDALKDEPKEKIKEYAELIKPRIAEDAELALHAKDAEFNESDHPRGEGGKFASIGSAGGKSHALTEKQHDKMIEAFPDAAYLHNSRNEQIDFLKGGGEYGGAFFLQNSRPSGLSNYGKHVHAFELDPAKTLDIGDERFEEAVRDWMTHQADRGMLESGYENLIDEHGGDVDAAASALTEQIRNMDVVESESSLMDMSEYLSEHGFGAVKTKGGALVYDPVNAMKAHLPKENMTGDTLALDRESIKSKDVDGRLHVADVPLCRESVDEYKGSEVPGYAKLGLSANKIYKLYRPAEELQKALPTMNGIPVLRNHVATSAADHKFKETIGSTGTNARWDPPFIRGELVVWPAVDVEGIENKDKFSLSPGYRYTPIPEDGDFNGEHFDLRMVDIAFNHIAVVVAGRQAEVAIDESVDNVDWKRIERAILGLSHAEMSREGGS